MVRGVAACVEGLDPFPTWAYEVLFVSKRLGFPCSSVVLDSVSAGVIMVGAEA